MENEASLVRELQHHLQELRHTYREGNLLAAEISDQNQAILNICGQLRLLSSTRDKEQITNYCMAKLKYSSQLAHSGNADESVDLTRGVLAYLIKMVNEDLLLSGAR